MSSHPIWATDAFAVSLIVALTLWTVIAVAVHVLTVVTVTPTTTAGLAGGLVLAVLTAYAVASMEVRD